MVSNSAWAEARREYGEEAGQEARKTIETHWSTASSLVLRQEQLLLSLPHHLMLERHANKLRGTWATLQRTSQTQHGQKTNPCHASSRISTANKACRVCSRVGRPDVSRSRLHALS